MEHIWDKDQFCNRAKRASQTIFAHARSIRALDGQRLRFEYGLVDEASSRGVVKLHCDDRRSPAFGPIWIAATAKPDGSWEAKHTFGSCS